MSNDFDALIALLQRSRDNFERLGERIDALDKQLSKVEQLLRNTVQTQQNLNNDLRRWNAK